MCGKFVSGSENGVSEGEERNGTDQVIIFESPLHRHFLKGFFVSAIVCEISFSLKNVVVEK